MIEGIAKYVNVKAVTKLSIMSYMVSRDSANLTKVIFKYKKEHKCCHYLIKYLHWSLILTPDCYKSTMFC